MSSKAAIVVGGSKGLGAAIVKAFEKENYHIVELSRTAPYPFSIRCDLTDPENTKSALTEQLNSVKSLVPSEIIFVYTAATDGQTNITHHIHIDSILSTTQINLLSQMTMINQLIKQTQHMDCQVKIIGVTTGLAYQGRAGCALYAMTKAAVTRLFDCYREEAQLNFNHCQFSLLDPGIFKSQLHDRVTQPNNSRFPVIQEVLNFRNQHTLASVDALGQLAVAKITQDSPLEEVIRLYE